MVPKNTVEHTITIRILLARIDPSLLKKEKKMLLEYFFELNAYKIKE